MNFYPATGGKLSTLLDAGSGPPFDLGLDNTTTRRDQTLDVDPVDIGFHYFPIDAPVASGGFVQTCRNTPVNLGLDGQDFNGLNLPLTFTVTANPTYGQLAGSGPNRTYTPPNGFEGPDSFTYKVNNGSLDSTIATVTIEVGFPPMVDSPPQRITHLTRPISYTLTGSDGCDEPHAPLIFSIVDEPTLGMPMSGTPPNVTYTPITAGSDSFTFKASDGVRDSTIATAAIEVLAAPGFTATCRPQSILLEWTISPNTQSFVDDFVIKRSLVSGGPYTVIATVPSTGRSFVDTTVAPGTTYYYVMSLRYTDPPGTIPPNEADSSQVSSSTCCPPGTDFWVDQGPTPQQLAEWIMAGSGISVVPGSASFEGAALTVPKMRGIFGNGGDADLPIEEGVILCSGDIALAHGPNNNIGELPGSLLGDANGDQLGDADLNGLVTGLQTRDTAVLTFDVTAPTNNTPIEFNYVFASEEYHFYIGQFNDIMAIWVDGENIAVVPGSSPPEPIAVNNIHNGKVGTPPTPPKNPDLFVDNETSLPGPVNIQYNGLTILLTTINKTISTGSTHHVKIAIADATDQILDSAVFIKASTPCP